MKNQYFGDINDYRKYGLLRTLRDETGLRLGVWWMLTPDDGREDGRFVAYLSDPHRWRSFDPPLFDLLAAAVPAERRVSVIAESGLLGDALFVDAVVPDNLSARTSSFALVHEHLRAAELLFVDPDNGLEIPSCPPGRKDSSKYVRLRELAAIYTRGQSIVVYQHLRREERRAFISRTSAALRAATGALEVFCFRTSHVAFFLVAHATHALLLKAATRHVREVWGDQIRPWPDLDVGKTVAEDERMSSWYRRATRPRSF